MPAESLTAGLLEPSAYPHPVGEVQLVETHISWVFLTGDFAYKVKKPVKLGFLDFSTLERRRHFCEEELRINRRTAPELYIGVVPIGTVSDRPRIDETPAIEYAVKMRQFSHRARLDRCLAAGELDRADMGRLAVSLAEFHAGIPFRERQQGGQEARCVVRPALNNFRHLDAGRLPDKTRQQLAVIESWTRDQCRGLEARFEERAEQGFVRECHGDLHLENLLLIDGRFVPFDAIEFEPKLRWIDTANDIAFAVMDLLARSRRDLAFSLLNDWLQETGDYGSLGVMRFYLAYRSMVRAVVTAIRREQRAPDRDSARPATETYVELAARLADTPAPTLYLMHGLSGSGKTWVSERMIAGLPALRVRSDVERKRLLHETRGKGSAEGIESGLYRPEVTDETYQAMMRYCATGLGAGFDMIADATFLADRHSAAFTRMAAERGAGLTIVDCTAPEAVLRQRIRRRQAERRDASDADIAVLEHQLQAREPLTPAERDRAIEVDGEAGLERWLARVRRARPLPR
ncbi:MAG: AAA family ATPase [Xanthomonadales bacterium]|nr:AAA family ATPase [Xanthomonadales bacterium]